VTGRRLLPSKLGLVLVQGYHLIDSGLVLPKVRSDIEDECGRIAKGLANKVRSYFHFVNRAFPLLTPWPPFSFVGGCSAEGS
jgi:DNA topoisomerase-3